MIGIRLALTTLISALTLLQDASAVALTANSQELSTTRNHAVDLTYTGNVSRFLVTITQNPSHGTLLATSATTATYTPATDFSGDDVIKYKIYVGRQQSNEATITLHVENPNSAPIASDMSTTIFKNTAGSVLLAAIDADNNPLTYTFSSPSHGTLSGTAPNLTYTPTSNYTGTDSFTFYVSDGITTSNTATVNLTVDAVNDRPTATASAQVVNEDSSVQITLTGTDPENLPLTYRITSNPTKGTATLSSNVVTYTPNADYSGTDVFYFKVNDGVNDSANTASITITISSVNDAPVAGAIETSTLEDLSKNIPLQATDQERDTLTYSLATLPLHGSVSISGSTATYVPQSNYNGTDSFTYKARDASSESAAATVTISVTAVNDTVTVADQNAELTEDSSSTIPLAITEVDGETVTVNARRNPQYGTVTYTGTTAVYTPNTDFSGTDQFSYSVTDSLGTTPEATVSLTVTPKNDLPIASNATVSAVRGQKSFFILQASDADGDPLTYSITTLPRRGSIEQNGNKVVYTAPPTTSTWTGTESIRFKVYDGLGYSSSATVTVKVSATDVSLPLSNLTETSLVTKTSTSDLDTYTFPTSSISGCSSLRATPITDGNGNALIALHQDGLNDACTDKNSDNMALYALGAGKAYQLFQGVNIEANGIGLNNGVFYFPVVSRPNLAGGGILKLWVDESNSTSTIQTSFYDSPGGRAVDTSLGFDPNSGNIMAGTTFVPESCGTNSENCGVLYLLDTEGQIAASIGRNEGQASWYCGGAVAMKNSSTNEISFKLGTADGDDIGTQHGYRCSWLETSVPTFGGTGSFAITQNFDPGTTGCTGTAPYEDAATNGSLVFDTANSRAFLFHNQSNGSDEQITIYQTNISDFTVQRTYTFTSPGSNMSFTNGFYNTGVIASNGHFYMSAQVKTLSIIQQVIIDIDPSSGSSSFLAAEASATSGAYSPVTVFQDSIGNEFLGFSNSGTAHFINLANGVDTTYSLGVSDRSNTAPIAMNDGIMYALSTGNVVVLKGKDFQVSTSAPWPINRQNHYGRALVEY